MTEFATPSGGVPMTQRLLIILSAALVVLAFAGAMQAPTCGPAGAANTKLWPHDRPLDPPL